MGKLATILCLSFAAIAAAEEPTTLPLLISEPDAFRTLVNPQCSHCRDEAKRRAGELRDDDRALCWIRGYSDGGAIPIRFFLNSYRVISDSYGVFVYDPDAGYARGFAPSYEFTFHGWRNGVMVMQHKDGTLYSCLTGKAFEGPQKGSQLEAIPTLTSDWGDWLERYPHAVAYHMFDKYQPTDLPTKETEGSRRSRGKADTRLPDGELVLGVADGNNVRAYRISELEKAGFIQDAAGDQQWVVLWNGPTRTAAAYLSVASPADKEQGDPRPVTLRRDAEHRSAPFVDKETGSHWDIAGRAVEGELKGWTLQWLNGVQVKWFAWAAENPETTIHAPATLPLPDVSGSAEFLRAVPKHFARLVAVNVERRQVTLLVDGEQLAKEWTLAPDAEVKVSGWWGRLDQFNVNDRIWAWFKLDRGGQSVAIMMLADELSEQDMHGTGVALEARRENRLTLKPIKGANRELNAAHAETYIGESKKALADLPPDGRVYVQSAGSDARLVLDPAAFERRRGEQKSWLRERWAKEGLPGTVAFLHIFSGEMDLILDHEAMRWGRSLKPGDAVTLEASPAISATVKEVTPWRERTQLRLVVNGIDQADLAVGQRMLLRMAPPPHEVDDSPWPSDVGRSRSKTERIEWVLASVYCACHIDGDTCTGQFYTLSSCNPKTCSMPAGVRQLVAAKIDRGLSDRQILEELLKEQGPDLLRPHLTP